MLTLIALSTALLQEPPAPPPPLEVYGRMVFLGGTADGPGGLDADGDGQVTRDEFTPPLNDAFGRMDKDGDGRLSPGELSAERAPVEGAVTIHRRGGGDVERFELRRSGEGERTMVFVGPNGGREEPRVVVRTVPDDGPAVVHFRRGPDGAGEGRVVVRTHGGPGHGPDDLDKDGDGKVSEAEFIAPLREAFARMDADHSGFIDEGEHGGENQVHVFTRRFETRDHE